MAETSWGKIPVSCPLTPSALNSPLQSGETIPTHSDVTRARKARSHSTAQQVPASARAHMGPSN